MALNNPVSSAVLAGNFREEKRRGADVEENPVENNSGGDDLQSWRELSLLNKKKQEADKTKGGLGKNLSNAAGVAVNAGTSKLLQAAWENLIDSFGLTLIWVNIHAIFLNPIFGEKYFCKLGQEWGAGGPAGGSASMSKASSGASAAAGKGKAASAGTGAGAGAETAGQSEMETASRFLGLGEWMILGAADLLLVLLIVGALCLIALVIGAIENPMRAIYEILKTIVGNLWK